MPSLRSLFLSFTTAVALVAAGPSTTPANSLLPRGAVFNPRCECYQAPLPVVIDDATSKITPLVEQLKSLDAASITVEKIQPIAIEIKGVIADGIGHLNLLAKSNAEATLILSTGNGTLSVSETATLLAGLVNLVFGALGAVLKLVVSAQSSGIIALFAEIVIVVAEFVNISVSLVTVEGGLLAAVLPLIKTSLGVAINLGVTSCFHFLDIDFVQTAVELGVEVGVGIGAGLTADVSVSLITIVKTAFGTIKPLAEQLKNLSPSDCNASTVAPIVGEIRTVIVAAISQITVLVGQSAEAVLSFEGKVLTVADAAGAVGELVIVLFDGICEAIKVVPASESKVVIGLFVDLGISVGQLIKTCSNVITFDGGLIVALNPIIKDAVPLAITLGITGCYDFLGVDWAHIGVTVGITVGAGGVLSTLVGAGTTVSAGFTAIQTAGTGSGPTTVVSGQVGGPATTFVSSIITAGGSVPTGSVGNNNGNNNGDNNDNNGDNNGNHDDEDDFEDCDEEDGDYDEHGHPVGGQTTVVTVSNGVTTTFATTFATTVSVPTGGNGENTPVTVGATTVTGSSPVSTGATTPVNGDATTVTESSPVSTGATTPVTDGTTTASGGSPASSTAATATTSGALSVPTCSAGADGEVSVSLVLIVQQISVKVTALVEKLKGFSADECNKETVEPVVAEIKAVFVAAIEQVKVFVGASVNVVLASDCNGTVSSVSEFATLFGTLINLVLGAILVVIKTATGDNQKILISIFVELGICIGDFIKVVCGIVTFDGGLTVVLVPIIKASLGICVTLGIKASFEFLNIDWTTIGIDLGLGVGVGVGAGVSIVTIVNNATTVITPLIEKLTGLGAADCTGDNIRPIVLEIQAVIKVAIEQIKVLVGASVDVVLASGTSVISVGECGKLVGDLINLIFGACGGVLKIVVSGEYKVVIGLFAELGVCVGDFIKVCGDVVAFDGGLVAVLTPIIQTSIGICVTLGIKDNFGFLNIDWTKISVGIGATVSIVTILNNATTTVTPLIQSLKDLSADDCTADKIGPIVIQIKAILSFTIEQIKVLAGASVDVVLASGAGAVISIGECGKLVGGLVNLILETVAVVLKIVVAAEVKAVSGIFAELCVLVGTLLQVCVSVVTFDGGLVAVLVPIVKASLGVCIQLDVVSNFDILGIDFAQLAIDLGLTLGVVIGVGAGAGVGATASLTAIIGDLTTQITPLIDQLKGLKASDCGGDAVGGIVGQIKTIIVSATAQIKVLTAANIGCTVDEATTAVVGLLQLVFGAIDAVLKVVGVANAKVVFGLCAELGATVAVFVQACVSVVAGLETSIIALVQGTLKSTLSVVIKLALTADFGFLGIDFNSLSSQLGLNLGGILNTLLGFRR
ncbi:hypothetical protein AAF712_011836 [Marasmius tenuissimus]|uniref:Uncharacterized protein n=1 Tax=Marasmius tenuissimus TaxID=585030 RepID=A0ABR2ZK17_9AGAR